MKNLKNFLSLLIFLSLVSVCIFLPKIFKTSCIEANENLKEASFYKKLDKGVVQCQLCPRTCVIPDGKRGFCGTRENHKGVLYTLVYAKPVTITFDDPIEKKPFFHFLPATKTFSIATAGCNLKCKFCQNWEISQKLPEEVEYFYIEPENLVKKLIESGRPSIAYTYSEPTIFFEYMLETAKLAKQHGIKNVMHSNGFINEAPLRELAKYLDAADIDLKGFTDDYYKSICEGRLDPVLRSLKILKDEGVHIEITNLILPGYNDNEDEIRKMCLWIKENLGEDTPLHFSRFFPTYKLIALNPTPAQTLENAHRIALGCGLKYVYIGNLPGNPAENTFCPKCKKIIIERKGYFVAQNNIIDGKCKFCKEEIKGVWN
ncbi:MAG: AmmeMemoRadiSam system radical SAM enzyme [Candidatus Omnitrophica bacterium]|nr:AmmeMemoRadiSam system radical SAM enzyme [Candidatus Omnitrophota bacterium]